MKANDWLVLGPVFASVVALITAGFGFLRNRRSDTITLYSTFVDDLHDEVIRLRSQYDDDRKNWDGQKSELLKAIDDMRSEISSLQGEVQRLRLALEKATPRAQGGENG